MAQPSPETVWNATEKKLLSLLDSGSLVANPKKVTFYAPSFAHYKTRNYSAFQTLFPTLSVTGNACALNCKHCGAKVLKTMQPATSPEKLFEAAQKLKTQGAAGCLVSGGCTPKGSVPLQEFIPILGRVKRELGLTVLVHTGIIDSATAKALKVAEVDAALIDIIGSGETVKEVCGLSVTAKDYENSLKAMHEAGLSFVPHVIVGLQNGKLHGEFKALRMISRYKPSALVIIAFMPIRGTEMANVKPPSPLDIARVVASARLMFPETALALGCMRPKGKYRAETDCLCLKAGVDAVAFPSEEAVDFAEEQGYGVAFSGVCCSQIYVDSVGNCFSRRVSK
jgi:uncharacterized radical SAM superfamily protein